MPLQHRAGRGVSFLTIDAPIFQFIEWNPHVGYRATHKGSRRDHAEIAVEKLQLCLAMTGGTEFVQHG